MIEWNDEREDGAVLITSGIEPEPPRPTSTFRTIAAVMGALGALMLAAWGIRRLRAA